MRKLSSWAGVVQLPALQSATMRNSAIWSSDASDRLESLRQAVLYRLRHCIQIENLILPYYVSLAASAILHSKRLSDALKLFVRSRLRLYLLVIFAGITALHPDLVLHSGS